MTRYPEHFSFSPLIVWLQIARLHESNDYYTVAQDVGNVEVQPQMPTE